MYILVLDCPTIQDTTTDLKWALQTFIAVAGNFCIDWDSNSICRIISWSKWTNWVLNPKWRKRLQHFQNCTLLHTLSLSDFHPKNATLIWQQKKVQRTHSVSNFWEKKTKQPFPKKGPVNKWKYRITDQLSVLPFVFQIKSTWMAWQLRWQSESIKIICKCCHAEALCS